MPDPNALRIGDRVVFTSLPNEWSNPLYPVPPESLAFMRRLIRRGRSSRVCKIDPTGGPWIRAIFRVRGVRHFHS
jgi:hypothetical protein